MVHLCAEGAHVGRGLGRNFLRHLRRTSLFLHVVDGSTPDPVADYIAIRTELQMYNPEYCSRPHVVALNKMDLSEASSKQQQNSDGILAAADAARDKWPTAELPEAVIPVSAADGMGVNTVGEWIQRTLDKLHERELQAEDGEEEEEEESPWVEDKEGQEFLEPTGWY